MKRALMILAATVMLCGVGCTTHNLASNGCKSCGGGGGGHLAKHSGSCGGNCGHGQHGGGHGGHVVGHGGGITGGQGFLAHGVGQPRVPRMSHSEYHSGPGPQGPPTAGVAYPYYTTRGPRDFLLNNPPSLGY